VVRRTSVMGCCLRAPPDASVCLSTSEPRTPDNAIAQAMDSNSDGLIEFSEWAGWWAERKKK
jgi:hypothetical protein